MSSGEFFAVEGPEGINALQLGPMKVSWHSLEEGRVALCIDAGGHDVNVYSSPTGRSVRVFKDGKELR